MCVTYEIDAKRRLVFAAPTIQAFAPRQPFSQNSGAARGTRTPDPRFTKAVLYQLSYCGTEQRS